MIPKFNPSTLKVEYVLPTKIENDEALLRYHDYIRDLAQGGQVITEEDVAIFFDMLEDPRAFDKRLIKSLFELLQQVASLEHFVSPELARECVARITHYSQELNL